MCGIVGGVDKASKQTRGNIMLTLEEQNELLIENRRMRKALEIVRDWNLPLIEKPDGKKYSYESQLGSNGARD